MGLVVNLKDMALIAEQLGHTAPAIESTPAGRWFGTCSCGYKSTTRTSARLAAEALIHHMRKEVSAHSRNGTTPLRRTDENGASQQTRHATV